MPEPGVQPASSKRLLLDAQFGYGPHNEEEESSQDEMDEDQSMGEVQCQHNEQSFSCHQPLVTFPAVPPPAIPGILNKAGSKVGIMSIDVGSAKDLWKGASAHGAVNEDDTMAGARIGNAPTQAIYVNSVNQEGIMAGAYLSNLSGNHSTQALSTYSCPSIFALHHGHGASHQHEGWQNENPHVNENQADDPGRDLAGGPKAAGVGVERNSDGSSDGGEAEVVGTKRNPQGMEISSEESEMSSLESEPSDLAWVRK